jgi:hypothetical protein
MKKYSATITSLELIAVLEKQHEHGALDFTPFGCDQNIREMLATSSDAKWVACNNETYYTYDIIGQACPAFFQLYDAAPPRWATETEAERDIREVAPKYYTHTKESLLSALEKFANQRPGLEYGNYGCQIAYRAEVRHVGRQLQDARTLLRAVALSTCTIEKLVESLSIAKRLSLRDSGELGYCTGQYWPTEYRAAVCRLCSDILWHTTREVYPHFDGTEIRAYFRRWFGKGLAKRWFN